MAKVQAGDIRQIMIDGREFNPAPESSCNVLIGGESNKVAMTGNRKMHITQNLTRAGIADLVLSIDDEAEDLEALAEIAGKGAVPVSMTLASGIVRQGNLVLEAEDLGKSTGEGTATIGLFGESFEKV